MMSFGGDGELFAGGGPASLRTRARAKGQVTFPRPLPGGKLADRAQGRLQSRGNGRGHQHPLCGEPVSAASARRCLLAYGHFEEEAGGWGDRADATGHVAPEAREDRWEGQRTPYEGPRASGLGTSGTILMARSFESFRSRS